MRDRVDAGLAAAPERGFGAFAQLVADKGLQHEAECLAHYRSQGKSVLELPARARGEAFEDWTARVGKPFDSDADVLYQVPLIHDGIRGIADFLVRTVDPHSGLVTWEPVDAKLARSEAKPGHVLQLCFYAQAIEALTGRRPASLHIWLGSGAIETITTDDVLPYWNRLRAQLPQGGSQNGGQPQTVAEPCAHCTFCEFAGQCETQWRDEDSLVFVADIRSRDRAALEAAGVTTLAALAACQEPVPGMPPERLARLTTQASLQLQARRDPLAPPPFRLRATEEPDPHDHGFALLPAPDDGDVFLDFEGHPFWRPDTGLFFLMGLVAATETGEWAYRAWWAHSPEEEALATRQLIAYLAERRAAHPGMHVYHYNHTERSSLQRLTAAHGVAEAELAQLVDTGLFVDLLAVARGAAAVGVESYGLKHLERLTAFERGDEIDEAAAAVIEYEAYRRHGDPASLSRIATYNEDDVRATRALRDWLLEQRPQELPWRPAVLDAPEGIPEVGELVARLHTFPPDSPEHLLGDVLGYWQREWEAYAAPKLLRCQADPTTLLEDPEALADLRPVELVTRLGKRGDPITPAMRFSLPPQDTSAFTAGDRVLFTAGDLVGFASIDRLDVAGGVVDLIWNDRAKELGAYPPVVIRDDWFAATPKPQALAALAGELLDGTTQPSAFRALLHRELPAFRGGAMPSGPLFTDDLAHMTACALALDHSTMAVQGPPGTGKTYAGARLIHALIGAGKRVGITAFSHHAIDNLLEEVAEVFTEHGTPLAAVRKGSPPGTGPLAGVTYVSANGPCARPDYQLVAGTTWLFAGRDLRNAPVDVLVIDEAGQLALADALACCQSAGSLILLGDPQQLPQVAQASHPQGSGRSVLEHVLGDHATLPPTHGVFLTETRRMHPDIARFISERIYEGRLRSHASCAVQATAHGTGLRWLAAGHTGCSTESAQEAELVAGEIERLLGSEWTNQDGVTALLTAEDFMVVAPYNDQVNLVRRRLHAGEATRGVRVGTVDKFQGREAPVVFFTMTASTAQDIPRGTAFLFSRNRLNVAVSRARCLAYLVCTPDLLSGRARDIAEMKLLATLCAFAEAADH